MYKSLNGFNCDSSESDKWRPEEVRETERLVVGGEKISPRAEVELESPDCVIVSLLY